MRVLYATDKIGNLTVTDNIFVFTSSKGVEVQPGEIKKIPTGVILRIEEGYTLTLTTHPNLVVKVGQLFPAVSIVTAADPEDYLFLSVHNLGRNPFRIMSGDVIARGVVTPIEPVNKESYTPETSARAGVPRSRPQRRNSEIEFEVR